jgi:hypothetical protein
MQTCRHCQRPKVNRPRGLCWPCYYLPGVRELYPSTSKFGRRGVAEGKALLPPLPTDATPGSPAKIAVLEARAAAGVALWHPLDWRPPRTRGRRSEPCRVILGNPVFAALLGRTRVDTDYNHTIGRAAA